MLVIQTEIKTHIHIFLFACLSYKAVNMMYDDMMYDAKIWHFNTVGQLGLTSLYSQAQVALWTAVSATSALASLFSELHALSSYNSLHMFITISI